LTELTDLAKCDNKMEELMSFALQHGANYALEKPVSMKNLQNTLEVLNVHPREDQPFANLLVAVETESPRLSPDVKMLMRMKESTAQDNDDNSNLLNGERYARRRSRSSFGSVDEYYSNGDDEGTNPTTRRSNTSVASNNDNNIEVNITRRSIQDLDDLVKSSSAILEDVNTQIDDTQETPVVKSNSQRRIKASSFCADDDDDPALLILKSG